MILYIKLRNFGCHKNLEVQFTSGLQVIRGSVEAGKSTLMRGLLYFFYGARALPLSLAETVTWGEPESSLRVEVGFTHGTASFEGYRAKSGAQITGPGLTVSGQAEVTKFVEQLFGANADKASKLMLAKQKDLGAGLGETGGAAIDLIQSLANYAVLDDLIERIQAQLPCGNTRSLEDMIAAEAARQAPQEPDWSRLDAVLAEQQARHDTAAQALAEQQAELAVIDKVAASVVLANYDSSEAEAKRLETELVGLQALLDAAPAPEAPSQLADLQARKDAQDVILRAGQAWTLFLGLKSQLGPDFWEGDGASLVAFRKEQSEAVAKYQALVADYDRQEAGLQAQLITATNCSLCGKDLRDVSEVQLKNAALQQDILQVRSLRQHAAATLQTARDGVAGADAVMKADQTLHDRLLSPYAALVKVDEKQPATVPPALIWTGPDMSKPVDKSDYAALIRAEQARLDKAQAEAAARQRAVGQLQAAKERLQAVQQATAELMPRAQVAADQLLQHSALSAKVLVAQAALQDLRTALQDLQAAQAQTRQQFELQAAVYKESQGRLVELRAQLQKMNLHNTVIRKIREAKPEIARRLWDTVLVAVSHYFSKMRGFNSQVTRRPDGFVVDGHPIASLSGSTQDILGLAMRFALVKTFLPTVDFIQLDEPAAACNEERELLMLGLIATSEFPQTLMVTHSDLADTFAANLVQL